LNLNGHNLIGQESSAQGATVFTGVAAATGEPLDVTFYEATAEELDRALMLAAVAAPAYRGVPAAKRAEFLERIAEEILLLGDAFIVQAQKETGLPEARLKGERTRTLSQLRLFASVIREGSWVDARIDRAQPGRAPVPRPDLRRILIPLGPVAVFGASNFPFAFSAAGGDTASALAAGCPVVVKAHPAHPGTSEMAARAILAAAAALKMPDGVFSMLHGGPEVSLALVRHPLLQAVGFTGSLTAGRALFDAAAARPSPIPVYAEMGSVNPVFVLPGALQERGADIAGNLAASVTLGMGQFCTNPGVVVGLRSDRFAQFITDTTQAAAQVPDGVMLSPGIRQAYLAGRSRLKATAGVESEQGEADAAVFSTRAETFLADSKLAQEVFGPSTLIVSCANPAEMEAVARSLEGQLTVTVHGTPEDFAAFAPVIALLETKAGRLVFNGFPTGVEVSPAMQHGGPYPASTDTRSTSVGTAAILRFARPVCWQDAPAALLPPALRDDNPDNLWRLVDSQWTQEPLP
jgi:alpha-ketoglutaric semialdehyde dehydrogenase